MSRIRTAVRFAVGGFFLSMCCQSNVWAQAATAVVTRSTQSSAVGEIWERHTIDDSSVGADGVRLADFNGDGKLDIVTGWEQGGITRLYLQPSAERIRSAWPAVTIGKAPSVEDAVPVDLDGDGRLDVVSSTEGQSRTLFVHWSPAQKSDLLESGKWKTEPIPQSIGKQAWMFCLPLQMDGKNGTDLVTGSKNPNGAVGWWESPERPRDLSSWKYHQLTKAGWTMSIFNRDLDGDGDRDLIFSDRRTKTRGLKWIEKSESAVDGNAWSVHLIGAADRELLFSTMADLDGDGWEDIINATWNGTIDFARRLPNRESTPQWKWHSVPNPFGLNHGKSVTVADFDRDGVNDIAMTLRSVPKNGPAVALLQSNGSVWAGDWIVTDLGGPQGSKFDLLEPIDLDSDGDIDLLTCEEVSNLGVFWYENPLF